MENDIKNMIKESIELKKSVMNTHTGSIKDLINLVIGCYRTGNKILICGNGGSAADSQHFAAEFVGKFKLKRKAFPCIALTTDTSILTAWSNDYGFDTVFSRQAEALGNKGDVLIAISTSGNSNNIIEALQTAKKKGMKTAALLGSNGGKVKGMADYELIVPSEDTPRIQEAHTTILHIICEIAERELCSTSTK